MQITNDELSAVSKVARGERAMATVRVISEIKPHHNADQLELAIIDGWQCVVKKEEFDAGMLVCYLEIDSWVPNELAPFLSKGKEPREYEGVKGERLKTIRLRGEVSQGLVLPYTILPMDWRADHIDQCRTGEIHGTDVSEILNVKKWEKPLAANMRGQARGNFPNFIQKTDQERVQNLMRSIEQRKEKFPNELFEVTLKMDGSSCTFFVYPGDEGVLRTGVCSRNLELKTDESNTGNTFVEMFRSLNIGTKLADWAMKNGRNIAIQGELWGEGINGNWEGVKGVHYHVFDVFDCDRYYYLSAAERYSIVHALGLDHVPVITIATLADLGLVTVADFLAYAERPSLHAKWAEGVVFKSTTDPQFSFKAISNSYLLSGGE